MKNNQETKEIYFIILYKRKEKEGENDFSFKKDDIKPNNIYTKEMEDEGEGKNKTYLYAKVFKYDKKQKNGEIEIQFEINKDTYLIIFNNRDKLFYYDIELKSGNKTQTNIDKEIISQNYLDYYEKFEIFLKALNKNKEEEKIDILYEETINLFSQNKEFNFLVSIFSKVFNKKNLCDKLIQEFYKININTKNKINLKRKESLNNYISTFSNIASEADNLIQSNGYNSVQFYGIILCYLNIYDYENFQKYFKKLYNDKCEFLFDILLIYYSNIINPIEQNMNFFVKFIEYTISQKEFNNLENALTFILDIETFIAIIDKLKEQIIEKYKNDFKSIKIESNLTFKKKEQEEEINIFLFSIKSIINFSKEKEILLIYFTSIFWKDILKQYDEPNLIYIDICYRLRNIFINYNELVNALFDDKNDKKIEKNENDKFNDMIKKDLNKYFERDEFAFILDKNIKNLFEMKKELSNSEILGIIIKYNPYYIEDKYKSRRDTNILDYINFGKIDKQFIETFKALEFEKLFNGNITNFLSTMTFKINNTFTFGVIMNLINVKKISKVKVYFDLLKKKYEYIVQKELNSLTGERLNEAIKIVAKFFCLLYSNEKDKKTEFFIKIDLLNKEIRPLVYNELIRICLGEEYKPMKEFIYKKFFNNIENIDNIDIIIVLIDSLSKENKAKFLKDLMFSKDEFYSNIKNEKIILLSELHKKGKLKLSDENDFYGRFKNILYEIVKDMEGDISKQKLEEFLDNGKDIVIKRLGLIRIILENYNPEEVYNNIHKEIKEINKYIEELASIKNSLSIFHNCKYLNEIREIIKVIEDLLKQPIKKYKKENIENKITNLKELKQVCEEINSVKDLLLFKLIYDESFEKDQQKRFNEGISKLKEIIKSLFDKDNYNFKDVYEKNKKIFNELKNKVNNDESKADLLIDSNNRLLYKRKR